MAYGNFKDLARRTTSDKMLRDKAFDIAKNPKYDGYQRDLASIVYTFMIKDLLALILQEVLLKIKLFQTINYQKNYTNQLLENSKNENYTDLLKTIFRVLI